MANIRAWNPYRKSPTSRSSQFETSRYSRRKVTVESRVTLHFHFDLGLSGKHSPPLARDVNWRRATPSPFPVFSLGL